MSNILCTGGAGFIGSHIVDSLVSKGHNVVIVDDLSTGQNSNINSGYFIKTSITESLDDIFDYHRFDYVFHLAAQINLRHSIKDPRGDAHTNIMGSLNVIENCIKYNVKRIIFSSTGGAIYSSDEALPFTESSLAKPESPYGLTKLTIENYLQMMGKLHGLKSTILRYSNVFGPRQNAKGEAGVISIFVERALQNKDLIIFGDGEQTRDFIYVDDVVRANLMALDSEMNGIFNVSSNTQCSIKIIADKILQNIQTTSKIIHADPVPGEMIHTQLCADKLLKVGWQPQWDINRGMLATIKYFK